MHSLRLPDRQRRRRHAPRSTPRAIRPETGLERLESRTLFVINAEVVDGALMINYFGGGDLVTLTSYPSSYSVASPGREAETFPKSAVTSIQVNDLAHASPGGFRQTQMLLIGGSAPITHPLSVKGIETTTLNANIANEQFSGDVSFGGPVILPTGRSVSIRSSTGNVLFGSTVNGAALLSLEAPGRSIVLTGRVGNSTPLARLTLKNADLVAALDSVAVAARGRALFSGIAISNSVKALSIQQPGSSVRGFAIGIEIGGGIETGSPVRTIRNFTISGNGVGIAFSPPNGPVIVSPGSGFHDWAIDGNTIADNSLDGIRVSLGSGAWTVSDVAITNNAILRNKRDGIRVEGSVTSLVVTMNTLTDNGSTKDHAAIRAIGALMPKPPLKEFRIADNAISAGKSSPATGITAKNVPHLTVSGNTVTRLARGISLSGSYGPPLHTLAGSEKTAVVTGNTVTDAGDVGIVLDSARLAALSGNSVSASPVGVLVTGACSSSSMTDTKLEGNDEGVRLSEASGLVIKTLVAKGNGSGIRLIGSQGVTIEQASVTASKTVGLAASGDCKGSKVTGGTFGGGVGISLAAAENLSIAGGFTVPSGCTTGLVATGFCFGTNVQGGTITGAVGNGIELMAAKSLQLADLTVKLHAGFGLKASGDSSGTAIAGGSYQSSDVGIGLVAAKNLVVQQASITANKTAGVSSAGDCTGSAFSDCDIDANQTGISLDGATGTGFVGCRVKASVSTGLRVKGASKGGIFQAGLITASGGNGALLSSAAGFSIYGTKIDGSGQAGLYAEGNCAGGIHNGNTISKSGSFGVSLNAAKGINFKGVTVSSSGSHGLLAVGDCTATKLDGSTFQGNGQIGIVLNTAKGLSVTGCISKENTAHGFQAFAACTGSTVTGSTFTANKLAGFVLSGVQDLTANAGNTIESNAGNGLYADNLCTGTK
ncbi:MAG: right-handed parallel beta-helix repeat-containing protein, partial [Planctomycetia bacterium]